MAILNKEIGVPQARGLQRVNAPMQRTRDPKGEPKPGLKGGRGIVMPALRSKAISEPDARVYGEEVICERSDADTEGAKPG